MVIIPFHTIKAEQTPRKRTKKYSSKAFEVNIPRQVQNIIKSGMLSRQNLNSKQVFKSESKKDDKQIGAQYF